MPNLEIVRCALTLDTATLTHQYGWVVRGVATWYCLPFRSLGERERFVRLLTDHVAMTASAAEVEALAALLCLSRSHDDTAYGAAAACLEREFAALLSVEPVEELDDAVDRLLEVARAERTTRPHCPPRPRWTGAGTAAGARHAHRRIPLRRAASRDYGDHPPTVRIAGRVSGPTIGRVD